MAEGRLIPLAVNVKRNVDKGKWEKSYLGEKSLNNVTLSEVYIFKVYESVEFISI